MSETPIPNLTIRDKLNVPYLLATQILTIQKAMLDTSVYSEREIREAVNGLVALIPDSWKDTDFEDELKNAKITLKIDQRPKFCGLSANLKTCKELGIEPFKSVDTVDSYKLFHATINLLHRRGLLSQVTRIEKVEGVEFTITTKNY